MARTATETTTKTATRRANAKSKDGWHFISVVYRAPSAYNLFVKEHMKTYLAEHPGKTNKDAMKHIGALWKDAPENPKCGQETKEKASKAPKRPKKVAADVSEGAEGSQDEPGSDD
ncbi:hypothetical protein F5148DRAFT_184535 [Russula earlei]|uniref:Uncharacterized protein n=1 Tax=Russula earlei TaxID=71964 RepID=A0ACC0UK51_9AGAM|nr:hypothetical protein F5148DRAFT_184535 [Russula earlei]